MRYCSETKHNCVWDFQLSCFPQQSNHVAKSHVKIAIVIWLKELLRNYFYINHPQTRIIQSLVSKLQLHLEDLESFFKCIFERFFLLHITSGKVTLHTLIHGSNLTLQRCLIPDTRRKQDVWNQHSDSASSKARLLKLIQWLFTHAKSRQISTEFKTFLKILRRRKTPTIKPVLSLTTIIWATQKSDQF